jgi:nicotinate-nucleotide pyrophosphorylase (carboxylating)
LITHIFYYINSFSKNAQHSKDITSEACIPSSLISQAVIISKQDGIVFGHQVAIEVCRLVDSKITYKEIISDGNPISIGEVISELNGPMKSILTAERVVLNFLQRLSAVSTATKKAVDIVRPYGTKILDTRKTTPGFRVLEKAAVLAGGGSNHRQGLYDEFLIKNNHVDALNGDISKAISSCRKLDGKAKLKVEVRNLNEIEASLLMMPDGLLLDNFSPSELKEHVKNIRSNALYNSICLEASGGIKFENLESYAETGVDQISLGALTHSAKVLDLSLRFTKNIKNNA